MTIYFANMFCFGSAHNMVGVTGIRGCLGIVYVGNNDMYAVHIPETNDVDHKNGRKRFEEYVKANDQSVGKGQLFAFVNGKNRSDVVGEMKDMKKRLKSPSTTIYRIMKHLGTDSGGFGADSVAILVERLHGGCSIWYKRDDAITWVPGGTNEAGQYKVNSGFQGDKVPSEFAAHWWHMDDVNCSIETV